jgi:flagellar motor protein MotB
VTSGTEQVTRLAEPRSRWPWWVAVGAVGFSAFLYGVVYRPMVELLRRRTDEVRELGTRVRDERREIDGLSADLSRARADLARARRDLWRQGGDPSALELAEAATRLRALVAGTPAGLETSGHGLLLRLPDRAVYPAGDARPSTEGATLLARLGDAIQRVGASGVQVTVRSGSGPAAWDLSAARALMIVRELEEKAQIDPERLSVAGFARGSAATKDEPGWIELALTVPVRAEHARTVPVESEKPHARKGGSAKKRK